MPSELSVLETTLLALGVSVTTAGLLVLSYWALKSLRKWLLSRLMLMIRSR